MVSVAAKLPAQVGEVFTDRVRLSAEQIPVFAASVHDFNPLHHDLAAARAAGYPGLIASGTQIGSLLMALTATYFAAPLADGTPRNGLGMGFDIRFRAVVLADEDIDAALGRHESRVERAPGRLDRARRGRCALVARRLAERHRHLAAAPGCATGAAA